jgi:hypothetical protein
MNQKRLTLKYKTYVCTSGNTVNITRYEPNDYPRSSREYKNITEASQNRLNTLLNRDEWDSQEDSIKRTQPNGAIVTMSLKMYWYIYRSNLPELLLQESIELKKGELRDASNRMLDLRDKDWKYKEELGEEIEHLINELQDLQWELELCQS